LAGEEDISGFARHDFQSVDVSFFVVQVILDTGFVDRQAVSLGALAGNSLPERAFPVVLRRSFVRTELEPSDATGSRPSRPVKLLEFALWEKVNKDLFCCFVINFYTSYSVQIFRRPIESLKHFSCWVQRSHS